MLRSRLKNIISKSKDISKQPTGAFDKFKKSLPKEIKIGDNYRLEAAWKAYGSPKDYKQALWEGLIQPIDENTYKLPSIGYNEETDEYEYLNKGEDNETVAKDIRVWDNNVIPLVQELKLGGYVRTFNEEKDCWTYTKNSQKRVESSEDLELQVIELFLKGGKSENKEEINDNISLEDFINQKIQERTEAAIKKATTRKTGYKFKNKSWKNCIATATDNYGVPIVLRNSDLAADPKKYGFEELLFGDNTDTLPDGVLILDYNKPNDYTTPGHTIMLVGRTETGAPIYSYSSGSSDPSDMHNSTTKYFFDKWNDKVKPRAYRYIGTPAERAAWEEEYRAMYPEVESFKQGGQMSVIPEVFKLGGAVIPSGSLHAHKNHMQLASEGLITPKGIPVVSEEDGEIQLLAEIEREEVIFDKRATTDIEKLYKKFNETDKLSEKDEIAIKAGKILTDIFINNTEDNTGLIEKVADKNNLEYNK